MHGHHRVTEGEHRGWMAGCSCSGFFFSTKQTFYLVKHGEKAYLCFYTDCITYFVSLLGTRLKQEQPEATSLKNSLHPIPEMSPWVQKDI